MSRQRGLRPALAGLAVLLTLCGLLFAATATVSADDAAGGPAAARRTPTPSDTPQPTATLTPAAAVVSEPAPATPAPADELVVLFNDLEHIAVSRYPDGSISFWRAHPERGDWGFVAWLAHEAQPGERGALIVDVTDDRWHLTVQRIDDCGGPAPKRPADPAEWHLYAARAIARMMCDGRPMYYLWLTNAAGQRVTEGAFAP